MTARSLTVPADIRRCNALSDNRPSELRDALSVRTYGYRYVTKSEGGGEARYVVVLAEAQVAREIFLWVGIEGCSLGQVCKRLKERGVLTQKGRINWDRATVVGMLRNPAYMGEARFGKERVVPAQPRLRPRRGVPEYP